MYIPTNQDVALHITRCKHKKHKNNTMIIKIQEWLICKNMGAEARAVSCNKTILILEQYCRKFRRVKKKAKLIFISR